MITTSELVALYQTFCTTQNVPYTWHSYLQIPQSSHVFSTYNVEKSTFYGADNYATMRDDNISISLFFKDNKLSTDFTLETSFEQSIRSLGEFTKSTGFDSSNNVFYTEYTINTTQRF